MIVDFQHHFTPRELIKEDPGDRMILNYDAQGAVFAVTRQGRHVCEARPQRRFYPASNDVQSKVWLCFEPLNDLYVVEGLF